MYDSPVTVSIVFAAVQGKQKAEHRQLEKSWQQLKRLVFQRFAIRFGLEVQCFEHRGLGVKVGQEKDQ